MMEQVNNEIYFAIDKTSALAANFLAISKIF
jgi:hypothetical protein